METTPSPGIQEDGTWFIPTHRVGQLARRVEILNRRVRKTGGSGLGLDVVRELSVERTDPENVEGSKLVEKWSFVRVTGEVPVVAGWSFVARVEHSDVGNIVAKAPSCHGLELPADLRTAGATCDHCKARRDRKDTFVLRGAEGVLRRVGRNCLADFLRNGDPESALRLWSLLSAVTSLLQGVADEGYEGGGGKASFETVGFLACTCAAIRAAGWTSKAAAMGTDKQPTAALASWIAGPAPRQDGRARNEWRAMQPSEEDFEEAGEVVAWIEDLAGRTDLNDYLHNLRVAVMFKHVVRRHEGIVASGVMARRRELERAAAQSNPASLAGKHVGVPEKRMDFSRLTVVSLNPISNSFGSSTIVTARDPDGNTLKWFARGIVAFKAGDSLRGRATVKSHDFFKGLPQTMLFRGSFEVVPAGSVDSPSAGDRLPPSASESDVPF